MASDLSGKLVTGVFLLGVGLGTTVGWQRGSSGRLQSVAADDLEVIIWRFPEIEVPPNHPFSWDVQCYKPYFLDIFRVLYPH